MDFKLGAKVYLTGPVDGATGISTQPFDKDKHRLYNVPGEIIVGPNGSIEAFKGGVWVKFQEDTQPYRQVQKDWLSFIPAD